jgi:predicted NAD/FAD-binding protein
VLRRNAPPRSFDEVVMACHADEALALLLDPSPQELRLLGSWKYQDNDVDLHTDASILPRNRRAWASWNYVRRRDNDDRPVEVTYHMNRLQGLKTQNEYCVTLNSRESVNPALVHRRLQYSHPTYSFQSLRTQPELPSLNGVRNTYFCGSYFGYGFHEDAVVSGLAVARAFGESL